MVSFKNIVKAGIEKRKASNAANSVSGQDSIINDQSSKRDDSEKRSSLINLQRVAKNPIPVTSSQSKPGTISLSSKGDGKTLNITVMRN